MRAVSLVAVGVAVMSGCGSSHRQIGLHPHGFPVPAYYAVRQVEAAFASQGIDLRERVTVPESTVSCGHVASRAECRRIKRMIRKVLHDNVRLSWSQPPCSVDVNVQLVLPSRAPSTTCDKVLA